MFGLLLFMGSDKSDDGFWSLNISFDCCYCCSQENELLSFIILPREGATTKSSSMQTGLFSYLHKAATSSKKCLQSSSSSSWDFPPLINMPVVQFSPHVCLFLCMDRQRGWIIDKPWNSQRKREPIELSAIAMACCWWLWKKKNPMLWADWRGENGLHFSDTHVRVQHMKMRERETKINASYL